MELRLADNQLAADWQELESGGHDLNCGLHASLNFQSHVYLRMLVAADFLQPIHYMYSCRSPNEQTSPDLSICDLGMGRSYKLPLYSIAQFAPDHPNLQIGKSAQREL